MLQQEMKQAQPQETSYMMEAKDGMLVRVPESRLEAWQKAQRSGEKDSRVEQHWPEIKARVLEKLQQIAAGTAG